jgi:hypothetical protein
MVVLEPVPGPVLLEGEPSPSVFGLLIAELGVISSLDVFAIDGGGCG